MGAKTLLTLAVVRRLADISQDELAELIGCAQASISYWESGEYPLPNKYAERILRVVRPRLRESPISAIAEPVLRGLTKQDLRRPWDELLIEHYIPSARKVAG